MTFRFRRSGHIVIRCADPERTARFFREVVGFRPHGTVSRGMHFLTADFAHNHHMLLVRPARPGAPAPDPDARIGFARVAYEVAGAEAFAALRARLAASGTRVEETPGRIALRDPDGNLFEFHLDGAAASEGAQVRVVEAAP